MLVRWPEIAMALEQMRTFRAGGTQEKLGGVTLLQPDSYPLLLASELRPEHETVSELIHTGGPIQRGSEIRGNPTLLRMCETDPSQRTRYCLALPNWLASTLALPPRTGRTPGFSTTVRRRRRFRFCSIAASKRSRWWRRCWNGSPLIASIITPRQSSSGRSSGSRGRTARWGQRAPPRCRMNSAACSSYCAGSSVTLITDRLKSRWRWSTGLICSNTLRTNGLNHRSTL